MSSNSFIQEWVYTDVVKDHFMNPRNILSDPDYQEDGRGLEGSLACGDQMLVVIKVTDDVIVDLKWKTYGCASAIASTSMMSEMAIGMTLDEAYHLTPSMITDRLGGLRPTSSTARCWETRPCGRRSMIIWREREGRTPSRRAWRKSSVSVRTSPISR